MKRSLLVLVVLLPILLSAFPRSLRNPLGNIDGSTLYNPSRAWRVLEKTAAYMEGGSWIDANKAVYYYHGVNSTQVDSLIYLSYDEMTQEWEEWMYVHFTYIPGGEYVESTVMGFRMMGLEFDMMKTYSVYDNQHRLIHWYIYLSPFGAKQWEPMSRLHIIYTGNNQFVMYGWSDPTEPGEPPYEKISFTWDNQGRMLTETAQTSPDSTSWVNDSRTSYTWHPNDTTTGADIIAYFSHYLPQMAFMMFVTDFSSNVVGGMPSLLFTEDWDGSWIPSDRESYFYNANNTLNYSIYEEYDGDWMNVSRNDLEWDANQNISVGYYSVWEPDVRSWVPESRTSYLWGTYTGTSDESVPSPGAISLTLYPVPFRDGMNISVNTKSASPVQLSVYNLKGQLVHTTSVQPNSTAVFNEPCPAGIYFIKAVQDGNTTVRKALKLN